MKYINDLKGFRKDFYRSILLTWQAGKTLSVINICLLLLQAILPIVSLYFMKMMLELIVRPDKMNFGSILPSILGFSIAQFLSAVASQVSVYINAIQQQKLTNYLSKQVLQKAIEVDFEYYENPDYHDSLHLAQQQSQYQAAQLINNINSLLLNSLSLLFLIGYFISLQWFYAFIFVAVSIPLACIKWYYGYRLFKLEKKYIPMEREASYYHQMLTGVSYAKEVRTFGFGNSFIQKYKNIRELIYKGKKDLNKKFTFYSLVAQAIEIVAMVIIFISLAKNVWMGIITLGVFVIYIQGFQRLQTTSKNFLQSLVQIFQQRLFLKDIFLFFDIQSKTTDGSKIFPMLHKGLVIENVSFTYPQTGKQVLKNISVECAPGNIIAIVGENGSGKSTLVKLIAKLYEVQSGNIKIDNTDICDISNERYSKNTFFLFQDFEKYFITVEKNIALADDSDIRRADIESAASSADAHDFISALSEKYQTRLGRTFQKSEQLSGGQWQKLSLARTFYKKARLIVLDEPTSSIDAIAEYEIYKNLKELSKEKMVILISHRLYNLKLANTIYVMKDGSIAESGSFDELISKNGFFREMYNKQKL